MSDQEIDALQDKVTEVEDEVAKKIVGQRETLRNLLVCMMCDGNALLEGNPGLAKTMMVRTVADVTDLSFSRIQSTPDLMPSDVTGTEVIREVEGEKEFVFERGPVFANVVLADEINRATPKTQSAFLEAMEERQVTSAGETYDLPEPFFVLATQNPIDQEGTYPLPEAQSDRFMMKIVFDYPSFEEEDKIVTRYTRDTEDSIELDTVLTADELSRLQQHVRDVPIADDLRERAVRIVESTRESDEIEFGASPRASISLVLAAKALSFLRGNAHVTEPSIERMAVPVMRHRIILDFHAEREGLTPDEAIEKLV
ncbi:MAG: AAA family ATPase [Halobacteriota archaeon]